MYTAAGAVAKWQNVYTAAGSVHHHVKYSGVVGSHTPHSRLATMQSKSFHTSLTILGTTTRAQGWPPVMRGPESYKCMHAISSRRRGPEPYKCMHAISSRTRGPEPYKCMHAISSRTRGPEPYKLKQDEGPRTLQVHACTCKVHACTCKGPSSCWSLHACTCKVLGPSSCLRLHACTCKVLGPSSCLSL